MTKYSNIDTGELDGADLSEKATQMAQDLGTWLENYEPYFGQRFIVKTIKALHADLAKQLEFEQQFLN
ncbi:MAG: hypothetical protein JST15_11145 [Bacteroidetes bacterium]|nr:hypothetical protein [Bacteroidota bacterium]